MSSQMKDVIRTLKDIDDIVRLVTGKRIPKLVARGIELIGGSMDEEEPEPYLPPENPYRILGVRSDAADIVIKASYRALAREFHPDTGTKPDPKRFQAATEAYNAIMAEREAPRG